LEARKRIDLAAVSLACHQSPQTHRAISASDEIRIKRADDSNRGATPNVAHQKERDSSFRVSDDPMLAVIRLGGENRRQGA
jgi:hypothetical protein